MAIIVKGGGGKPEEEKTVTAGTSVIEVSSSSGKVMKKVTVNPTPTESKSVTPTTSELTITPSEGKHLSQVVVGAVEDVTPEVNAQTPMLQNILESLVGKAQGANATADKILEGYSAYVGQELLNGTAKSRIDGLDYGELTLTSETASITIEHNLGVTPKQVVMITAEAIEPFWTAVNTYNNGVLFHRSTGNCHGEISKDANAFKFTLTDGYKFSVQPYRWVAIA